MQNGLFVLNQTASGLNNLTLENTSIFPNPVNANQTITISNLKNDNNLFVELYDLQGSYIFSKHCLISNNTANFVVPDIASGFYVIKVYNGIELTSKKLVVR